MAPTTLSSTSSSPSCKRPFMESVPPRQAKKARTGSEESVRSSAYYCGSVGTDRPCTGDMCKTEWRCDRCGSASFDFGESDDNCDHEECSLHYLRSSRP
eukprot:CAMPEP_0202459058 /NCGR_PEP_ID=MMETSP1360-20130828/30882_1 /ASSEMBLY_ACC=CAM_ASM_000848 /TAXON_ID=515479 /ORGANISM="Licmophora paradoxa, Strain CCMP2313" /LENGTH=98 /DNA_ID=CAMNT_0049079899 /DNA_START=68 /DNA_END=364 /DNA_ORIENTATION=+